ncbi:hypothetical protein Nepgr_010370 [Nepenthes gracilis]|uniref:Uncharacterized protein n=1 Tax=Nepenthes gracilis TaxID=150966 RepID=A0AAD3SCY1_NEPGR|nr:hypothetical protein Nepgr_010370 [Nepenthes gracilis]
MAAAPILPSSLLGQKIESRFCKYVDTINEIEGSGSPGLWSATVDVKQAVKIGSVISQLDAVLFAANPLMQFIDGGSFVSLNAAVPAEGWSFCLDREAECNLMQLGSLLSISVVVY